MDETPIIVGNHQGYGLIRDDAMCIHISYTHLVTVPEQLYWFCLDKSVTVDGFAGYNSFKLR